MDTDDDKLLADVGRVLRTGDPVPADVTLAARSALIWRRMDADLAELLEDSATEAELTGVRGGATGWRALTFESPTGIAIEVEVVLEGADRTMIGQLIPAGSGRVALRHGRTQTISTADEMGRFRFDGVPSGPVSLRVEHADGQVETGWVTI